MVAGPPARLRLAASSFLLAAATAWSGCGRGDSVVVGSKNFTEQDLLGELVALWLEAETGLRVERRLHLGGSFICHRALTAGEIDLYVEYTGTAFTAILEQAPVSDPDSVYRAVDTLYRERFGLEWLPPLGFENTFAILVRGRTADSLGLRTISDVAAHAADWRPGFGYEFVEREDGFAGLRAAYGLEFGRPPRLMDLQLTYRALAEGRVDLIAGNSTDGQIEALDLRMLEDDRRYFPPYEAAAVARIEALEARPEMREALRALGGRITTAEMRRLNREVSVEGRDFRSVAREWVERERAAEPAGSTGGGDRGRRTAFPSGTAASGPSWPIVGAGS